jgi:outer membrane protein assembly factor BamB
LPLLALALVLLVLAPHLTAQMVGFGADGNNRYPDAEPPLKWGKEANVLWHRPLPAWSNACPVLIGRRIFLCAEPDTLVCLNRDDGRILWQRKTTYVDTIDDQAKRRRVAAEFPRLRKLSKDYYEQKDKLRGLRRKLKKNPDDADVKAEISRREARMKQLEKQFGDLEEFVPPPTHRTNGYTSATPATDGKYVVAVFSTGLAAGFDMEGNRLWVRRLDASPHRWGTCASPLIVDDLAIVQIDKLWGLDLATGEVKWKADCDWSWGTPVLADIGGTDVIFTARGDAVRARDGHILASRIAGRKGLDFNCPVIHEGRIYYISQQSMAFDLPTSVGDKLQLKPAWKCELRKGRYYATPLVHDGLVYAVHRAQSLAVIDAESGRKLSEKRLDLPGATAYPSPVLAGEHVLVSNDKGFTAVLKPGQDYEQLHTNELEEFRTTPVCDGRRLYIRTVSGLYCFSR